MKNTARELENMANAIVATLEYKEKSINEWVKPSYYVKISESGLSARFEAHYTNEDDKDDKTSGFTLLDKDSMTKLISYIEDDYYALLEIEPNN
jgi:hypothetical protein